MHTNVGFIKVKVFGAEFKQREWKCRIKKRVKMQNLTNLSGNSIRYWCRIKKKTRKNTELKKEEVKMQNLTNLSGNSIRCLVRGCKRGFGHSLICTEHWIAPDCWKLSWKRFEAGWGRKGMTNMLLTAFVIVCITVILSCQRLLKRLKKNDKYA